MFALVLDTEYTKKKDDNDKIKHTKFQYLVAAGWIKLSNLGEEVSLADVRHAYYTEMRAIHTFGDVLRECQLLVGHHIGGADLHLIRSTYGPNFLRGKFIWDTQVAQFVLDNQAKMFPSLDYCAELYGGTVKKAGTSDLIKDPDFPTEGIPKEDLIAYLKDDVFNTYLVFLGQVQRSKKEGKYHLIKALMLARMATSSAEYNGILINTKEIDSMIEKYQKEILDLKKTLHHLKPKDSKHLDIDSPKQLATILFGGTSEIKEQALMKDEKGEPILYKSGKRKGTPRYKLQTYTKESLGFKLKPIVTTPKGGSSTSEEALQKLKESAMEYNQVEFVHSILKYRGLSKLLNTYLNNFEHSYIHQDDKIHAQFNHCVAVTGRLSSSKPNLQNIP